MGRAGARRRGVRRRFRPVGTRRRACRGAAAGRRCRGASHASGVAHRRPDERRRRLGLRSPVLRLGLEPVGQVPCGGDLLPAELAVDESARTGEVGSFEPGALEHRAVQVGAGQVLAANGGAPRSCAGRTWPAPSNIVPFRSAPARFAQRSSVVRHRSQRGPGRPPEPRKPGWRSFRRRLRALHRVTNAAVRRENQGASDGCVVATRAVTTSRLRALPVPARTVEHGARSAVTTVQAVGATRAGSRTQGVTTVR